MDLIFTIHLWATIFMSGLCWFVQIVHYPLFRQIDPEQFPTYEKKNFITIFVAGPVMTIELATGLYLLYHNPDPIYLISMALLGMIWLSTFLLQVPIHLKLTQKASDTLIRKLIYTNWIRTIGWSLRTVLLCCLLTGYIDTHI